MPALIAIVTQATAAVAPFVGPISWVALGSALTVAGWLIGVGRRQGKQSATLKQHTEALRLIREDDLAMLWKHNREQDTKCQKMTGAILSTLGEIKGKVDMLVRRNHDS